MMNYHNFIEEISDSKQLLWNHYINCCNVLGQKVEQSYEEYFNTLTDERVIEMIEYLNLQSN